MAGISCPDDIPVIVQIDDPPSRQPVLTLLNLKNKLSSIRKTLETNSIIHVDHTLSFAGRSHGNKLAGISIEDEEKMILEQIVEIKEQQNHLYLIPEFGWKFLTDKLELEYGRTVDLRKANRKAFTIEDCEMNEIIDGFTKRTLEIDSEENQIMKK